MLSEVGEKAKTSIIGVISGSADIVASVRDNTKQLVVDTIKEAGEVTSASIQTVADIIKLVQKEDIVASDNDRRFFDLSPILVFAGSYAAFAAIPFSGAFIGSNIDLGIVYIVAVTGLVVAGILMAGWASNNKYSVPSSLNSLPLYLANRILSFTFSLISSSSMAMRKGFAGLNARVIKISGSPLQLIMSIFSLFNSFTIA